MVWAGLFVMGVGCSPTQPSRTAALRSIRYVRTRPVTRSTQSSVGLMFTYPNIRDPQHRSVIVAIGLRSVDDTTFVYDSAASLFDSVPVNTDLGMSVNDEAVSASYVARDIFVNDTKIRVNQAGPVEVGQFRIRVDGSVY
jgi:hypothetical protein